jgi:ubiquinone/menaquinone biosynthesis C-methylase UbiE
VAFDVSGDSYDRFMGRYSRQLAPLFADFAGIEPTHRVLDVGCGPGALTTELVRRVGVDRVAAVDPSISFVAAVRERLPGIDVREATAEELPFPDEAFDAALSQLVVAFMRDAVAGLAEMRRVTRAGGVVAAAMWDFSGGMEMLRALHSAAVAVAPDREAVQGPRRYGSEAELRELLEQAGVSDVEVAPLDVESTYADLDELWGAVQQSAGPIGEIVRGLDDDGMARYREEIRSRLGDPSGAFTLHARAWAARGRP